MQLYVTETGFSGEGAIAGDQAAFVHFPIGGGLPMREIMSIKQYERIARRRYGRPRLSRSDFFGIRPIGIVNQPLAPRQFRRILVSVNAGTVLGVNQILSG